MPCTSSSSLGRSADVPVAERIGRVLEAHGLTGLVLDRRRRRFEYEGGPAEVVLEVLPGEADPLGVVCREIERQLNLPFPHAPRGNPFRFFAVTGAHSFHLGFAYDHFIASGESVALLLNAIAEACAGTASLEAAPNLYPGTYRGLFLRHPVVLAKGLFNLPRLIATSRRSFRPRYARKEGAHNGFAYFRLDPDESATLRRTAKAWGVTVTDLFLAGMLLALSPLAAERHRERQRRELAVASIVNARDDFGGEPRRVFGQFLASFSVAHPLPEGIGLRELAQDVHTWTARVKRDKLYLQTIIALGVSDLMWPFLSGARRAGLLRQVSSGVGWRDTSQCRRLVGQERTERRAILGVLPGGAHRAALPAGLCSHDRAGHDARRRVVPDGRVLAGDGGRRDCRIPSVHRQPRESSQRALPERPSRRPATADGLCDPAGRSPGCGLGAGPRAARRTAVDRGRPAGRGAHSRDRSGPGDRRRRAHGARQRPDAAHHQRPRRHLSGPSRHGVVCALPRRHGLPGSEDPPSRRWAAVVQPLRIAAPGSPAR